MTPLRMPRVGDVWSWTQPDGTTRTMRVTGIAEGPQYPRAHGVNPTTGRKLQCRSSTLAKGLAGAKLLEEGPDLTPAEQYRASQDARRAKRAAEQRERTARKRAAREAAGNPMRPHAKTTPEQRAQIAAERASGLKLEELGARWGLSSRGVARICCELGVRVRPVRAA